MSEIKADIITIGDELLYGQTIDTNSAFMGRNLGEVGIRVNQIISISDDKSHILETLKNATSDIILITGGLGPTLDDITKDTLCAFFNDKLELNPIAWQGVQKFYKSRKREISDINKLQAWLPSTSICLPNSIGTASGMWFEKNNQIFISMPGVPREMKSLIIDEVIPRLKEKLELPFIKHQFVNTVGIPESDLATKIESWVINLPKELSLAFLPSLGTVKIRLTVKGDNKEYLEKILKEQTTKLIPIIKSYIYSTDTTNLYESISKLLIDQNLTISTAESCTGGNVAKKLTSVSGSSSYFLGGAITYSNEMKTQELGVSTEILNEFGAVSEETVIEMVTGAARKFKTDLTVATTGIAGPDGGTKEKPVGTVWIAISYMGEVKTRLLQIGDLGRNNNVENTTIAVFNLIRKTLQ